MTSSTAASAAATKTPSAWLGRGVAVAAALVATAFYLSGAFPYPDWLDSPELGSAAASLGLFHPPGSPLAVMIGHLVSRLPLGNGTYELMLLSPLAAACAIYGVCRLAATVWPAATQGNLPRGLQQILGFAVALMLALTPAMVMQAARLEVYTLALAFAVVTLHAAVQLARSIDAASETGETANRHWARAMFATGAGLAVHPLISVAAAAALLPAAVGYFRRRGLGRAVAESLGYGFAGGFWLLVVPLCVRGWRDHRWGDVKTVAGWLEFVTGAAFAHSFTASGEGSSSSVGLTLTLVVEGAGIGLTLAGVLGFALLVRRRRRLAMAYGLALLADLALLMTQKNVYLSNPDATGYMLLTVVVLALLAVEGAACVAAEFQTDSQRQTLASGLLVAAVLGAVSEGLALPSLSRSSCGGGIQFAREQLRALPLDASVRLVDFNLLFMFEYLQLAEGERPDVVVSFERDPVPEGAPSGGPLWTDAGPRLLQAVQSSPSVPWRRAGVLWSPLEAPATPVAAGPTGLWSAECRNGSVDERTADVLLWHGFWSSRVAQATGDAVGGVELARVAFCASPGDEVVAAHAASLGIEKSSCAALSAEAAAPREDQRDVEAHFGGKRQPGVATAWMLLLGLLAWAVGGLLPRGKRDPLFLVVGVLIASLGLYIF